MATTLYTLYIFDRRVVKNILQYLQNFYVDVRWCAPRFSDIGPPAGFVTLDSPTIHHRAAVCASDTCTAYMILDID